MKAQVLVRNGAANQAYELRDWKVKTPEKGEVLVDVEAFGLNFADVMARYGTYRDCPPLPAVVGYEVVGRVKAIGPGTEAPDLKAGARVVAFTRFGGYAQQVVTSVDGVVPIGDEMSAGEAVALATQYSTAWYCAEEMVRLHKGDHVLVQAAAGGVGTALVQMAKRHGCVVYGTAGSPEKIEYLKKQGVDHPINYRKEDFHEVISKKVGDRGLDVVFDSLGGKEFKKGQQLLGSGGRIIGYGAASRTGKTGFLADIKLLLGFGFNNPAFLLMQSKAVIGVNMLRIADNRPAVLKRCMENVVALTRSGELKPTVGGVFKADQLAEAHQFLESRKSIGKVVVEW